MSFSWGELYTVVRLVRPGDADLRAGVPDGRLVRRVEPSDAGAIGRLYFASYPRGVPGDSLEEAVSDITASFAGEYGEPWPDACLVASTAVGDIVGCVITVSRAPWSDTPDCPFVIELFTAVEQRRRGIARALMQHVLAEAAAAGASAVALRVAVDNPVARALYDGLGFVPWAAPG
ncbi:MAG TPA: GNAT family N-acetyltransferase [Actinomycetes bacterium]|jgi:ribosomal protein S18 acetylase RimI-like enzyme|nr:GNAT family N-acetyltransferase [Actinomycetes bacterium]